MTFNLTQVWGYLAEKEIETKIFISVFYAVGIFGMLIPTSFPLFTKLVSLALILSFLALYVFHPDIKSRKSQLVFLFIYLLSFTIEVAGVNTGLLFGKYQYGNSLGIKLFNTPIIIGLNWLLLVYISSSVVERFRINTILKIILASSIMLAYDLILEQVAPQLGMWHFKVDVVPFQNYLAWFVIALLLQSVIKVNRIRTENKLSLTILVSQLLFFLILTIFLKQ